MSTTTNHHQIQRRIEIATRRQEQGDIHMAIDHLYYARSLAQQDIDNGHEHPELMDAINNRIHNLERTAA